LVGFLIDRYGEPHGVRISFMIALGMALASVFLQERLMKDNRRHERPEFRPWWCGAGCPRTLRRLLLSDILVRFCEQIPFAFVIIWCMKEWKLSAFNSAG